MPRIAVIDLSHHNTVPTSLKGAREAGVVGVIHKATEATAFDDDKYKARRAMAADANLLWGAYHFLRPGQVLLQVEFFLRFAAPDDKTLIACDYEDPKVPVEQLIEFMDRLESKLGRMPVLYCGHVLKEKLKRPEPRLTRYRLWLAQYGPVAKPPIGWDDVWLWQYSDGSVGPSPHVVPGVNSPVDCNHFKGTDEMLRADWAGGAPLPKAEPPAKEPEPAADEQVVKITIEAPPGVRVEVVQS